MVVAAALLAAPAGAAATQPGQVNGLTAQQCAQERAAIGKKAFHKKYGAKHTTRSCLRRTRAQVLAALPIANQDCQDELAQVGETAFIEEYGDDPSDSVENSIEECVAEDVDSILNPDEGDDTTDDGTAA